MINDHILRVFSDTLHAREPCWLVLLADDCSLFERVPWLDFDSSTAAKYVMGIIRVLGNKDGVGAALASYSKNPPSLSSPLSSGSISSAFRLLFFSPFASAFFLGLTTSSSASCTTL